MPEPDKFDAIVDLILKEDARYDRKAYAFVDEGLKATMKALRKKKDEHVAGPELLQGLRAHALDQFGPLAQTVLNAWGVRRCTDFGEIVFNLIEYRLTGESWFKKTDTDRREDFSDIYDFTDAFVKPFLPQRPPPAAPPSASSAAPETA